MPTSRIRFTKASQVFDAFPDLADTVARPAADMTPQAYLDVLRQNARPYPALAYFAHVLPKREGVWWGHQCISGLLPRLTGAETEIMRLCEAWIRDGDDDSREAVKEAADSIKPVCAPAWIGLAAGWSGGSLSPNEDHRVDVPDDLTAKAVNTALLIAIGNVPPGAQVHAIHACLNAGIEFARGGSMVLLPVYGGASETATATAGHGG